MPFRLLAIGRKSPELSFAMALFFLLHLAPFAPSHCFKSITDQERAPLSSMAANVRTLADLPSASGGSG
jgi:hypothetical protein